MSGNLPIGANSPLPFSAPAYRAGTSAPVSARSFASVLAGAPSPAPAPGASAGGMHDAARAQPLIPLAIRLPVAAGEQFAGRALAAADLSVALWPPVTERVAVPVATAATSDQAHAIQPPDRMSRLLPGRV
jgi:hypothetical protein